MKATICDICREAIPELTEYQTITIGALEPPAGDLVTKEICMTCWSSPVILSEMRRTRTRKVAPKRGRPEGSKTRKRKTIDISNVGAPIPGNAFPIGSANTGTPLPPNPTITSAAE